MYIQQKLKNSTSRDQNSMLHNYVKSNGGWYILCYMREAHVPNMSVTPVDFMIAVNWERYLFTDITSLISLSLFTKNELLQANITTNNL